MSKFFSLIRAAFSQDMQIFVYKQRQTEKKQLPKWVFPAAIVALLVFYVGYLAVSIMRPLAEAGMSLDGILVMMMAVISGICFIEGIYKSQSILFEAKDNDMLMALPISRRRILLLRILKIVVFQLVFNAILVLPVFAVYVYFTGPGLLFYIMSVIYLLLLPIIPTVVGSLIGYVVRSISSRFKKQKIAQLVISVLAMVGIMVALYFAKDLYMVEDSGTIYTIADNMGEMMKKMFYPLGVFPELIHEFQLVPFLLVLAMNLVPMGIFVWIGSLFYFKILSRTRVVHHKEALRVRRVRARKPMTALIRRELARFFSSTVYVFNSGLGLVMMVGLVVVLCVNAPGALEGIDSELVAEIEGLTGIDFAEMVKLAITLLMASVVTFGACMSSITSSSVSLEGKSFNFTKSLPVSARQILASKIFASMVICLPLMLVSIIMVFFVFGISWTDMLLLVLLAVVAVVFTAVLGLVLNLKFPKLTADSDAEAIKQSASSMIAVFIGMGVAALLILSLATVGMSGAAGNARLVLWGDLGIGALATVILTAVLMSWGVKQWERLQV